MKVAVVGAGVCGLSAAKTLARRGHDVTLHEQFELFHGRGSSHGASRIVRRAYSDPFYTACMSEAYPLWAELERESERELVHEVGLVYFGSQDADNIRSVATGLSDLSVPFEIYDHRQIHKVFPDLKLKDGEIGIWTPEAGWVNAASALKALAEVGIQSGLSIQTGSVADVSRLANENDIVIVTAGAWITRITDVPVKVTLQTFAYIDAQIGGPVWIEDSEDQPYGFPTDEQGQKVGIHRAGHEIDPEIDSRQPNEAYLDAIKTTVRDRFGIQTANLRHPKTCLYTTTVNEDFLLGNLAPNVFFGSACSGHGFKMGPWIGRLLADFAEGKDHPSNHPRFASFPKQLSEYR